MCACVCVWALYIGWYYRRFGFILLYCFYLFKAINLALPAALLLHLHCPFDSLPSTVNSVELTYFPVKLLPFPLTNTNSPTWTHTFCPTQPTTCTQGLINNFLIDTKWKGSFSFFQHSQTCYRFVSIFNWNPKADDTYAFNFLYAIKYAYLCVYSINLYRCIMHCLTVLCDPALVCFALPSGSFVVVHNVHGAHWTNKIQT